MATATKDVSLNKKVSQFFWRSWAIQASWNYERQMNMGFLYGSSLLLLHVCQQLLCPLL